MNKKIIALLLACLFVMLPLISCSDNPDDDKRGDGDLEVPTDDNLADMDWDGEVFVVLTREDRSKGQAFNIVDLYVTEEDDLTDPISKAVFERNSIIEELYNAKIDRQKESNYIDIANDTLAYGEDYSAYMLSVQTALTLSLTGVLLDLSNEVNYINLEEEWWDSGAISDLSIKNQKFFALGDINTVDDDATWCVLFNKELRNRYSNLPNFYDAVENNEWTVDNMKRWASSAITDTNDSTGNAWKLDSKYQYGLYHQDECATVLLQASGNTPFTSQKNGFMASNLESLDVSNSIDAIKNLMLENSASSIWACNINNITYNDGDVWQDIARGGFKANKALFFFCHCGTINLIRDMDANFGILPIPKLSEEQEEYGNTIQYTNATCYVIPYNTANGDFSAFMLEAMAFYSSRSYSTETSLKVAYYETTLQRKAARDDESWDMLDLVFQNRVFDFSCAMNTQSINSMIVTACTTDTAWSTLVAQKGSAISKQVNEDIAEILGNK